ncbi:MAG: GNAT family N-acetyltransferase [Leptolyngbyaceae cyanobacterium MAG.088]|nr:GNAT family N-acetyltransferase [Leptolyngbyaceae cyanobacterium MAG.088]
MAIEIVRCELSAYGFAIQTIRETVFVAEQGVPVELEMDDRDPMCKHVLALVDGYPAGTARLDVLKQGKIGRLAVLRKFRRCGLGRLIMHDIESIGHEHQLPYLWCHAQKTAVNFYQALGYRVSSSDFLEAGLVHCKMQKALGQ